MKLDDSAKIVSMVSVIVGLMISGATLYSNRQLQEVQRAVSEVDAKAKALQMASQEMDNAKKEYDLSARLSTQIQVPLARSFALQHQDFAQGKGPAGQEIAFPPGPLQQEFARVLPGWAGRAGLMTGDACSNDGLKTRQVLTLNVANIGHADAQDVTITALEKSPPAATGPAGWSERVEGSALAYQDLPGAAAGWTERKFKLNELRGASAPAGQPRNSIVLVLASVSGGTSFYGTVLLPIEIGWTDRITRKTQHAPILAAHAATLRNSLIGAEIGNLASRCPH